MGDEFDFDAAVAATLNPRANAHDVRLGFVTAMDTNPDAQAEARRVARSTGVPIDTAFNLPAETKRQARLGEIDFEALAQTSPATAALLADVERAKLAHDDVDQLSLVERSVRQFAGGAVEVVGSKAAGYGGLLDIAQRNIAGAIGSLLPTPRAGGEAMTDSIAGPLIGEGWREGGALVKQFARNKVMVPSGRRTFYDDVTGGLGQLAGQIATWPIDRGIGLFAQGADIMDERIAPDLATQGAKDLAVLGGAAVTGITEKYALDKILGPLAVPVKNQIAATLARVGIAGATEGAQEMAENLGHDALRNLLTNPNAGFDLGGTLYEGGVGATVGAVARSVIEAALHVRARGAQREQQVQQGAQDAQAVQELVKTAELSKLRERAPDLFQEMLSQAAPNAALFIDAEALAGAFAQSGVALDTASPAIAEQFDTALANGTAVEIPVAQFMTHFAGKPYTEALLENVRTRPDGMSPAEVQALFQGERDLGAEIAQLAGEQAADLQRVAELSQIEQDLFDQFNTVGRFTPDVNRQYAALPRAFFDVMAQRLGTTPAELYGTYRPNVVGETLITADSLEQTRRGAFVPETRTIALLKNADLSTALHESAHWFLESYADMAKTAPALQQDMQTLLGWFGVQDLATWQGMTLDQRREQHEKFARGFESFLMEGKAPSIDLQSLFQRFRAWLTSVYRSLKGLNVELTPEVRSVLDRMLATDSAIEAAQRARAMNPLFTSAEQAAEFGIDWNDYQGMTSAASAEALGQMEARSVRDMTWTSRMREATVKRLNRDAIDKRKEVRKEARDEVAAKPVYRALRWFKRGEMTAPDGEEIKATAGHRLSIPALKAMYPEGALASVEWEKLGYGKYGALAEEGMHPDQAAEIFGFSSGDAMVRELLQAEPFAQAVEALTDLRMLERYGDLTSPEAIGRAADEAIHNDVRTRFLATELAGLQKAVGSARLIERMAKEHAAGLIAQTVVGKLRPAKYAAAEVKAGKLAEQALKKGDIREAIRQKRNQIINHAATRAAYEAQAAAQKTVARLRKIAATTGDALAKERNADIGNAARAILAEYGLGTRGRNPREYMEAVKAYDPDLYAVLEPMLLDAEATAKPLDDLTVGELRALSDSVESIWYLARRERQVEIDGQLMDREQVTQALTDRLNELGVPETVPGEGRAVTEREKTMRYLAGVRAALRRVEAWVDRMDSGKITGAFRRFVFTPISEAADAYRADAARYLKRYRDLLKAIEPTLKPGRIDAPELGYTFGFSKGDAGKAELLHALLHTGNDSNKRKLLLGRGWSTEPAPGVLDTSRWDAFVRRMIAEGKLTKADFDFVQGVWDLLEEIKPLAQKTHRAVFGRYFEEITAHEFGTPFGVYRGGYVPAITDTFEVQDAALNAQLDAINQGNAFMFPATNRGFTKSRVEYNRPLALDLRLLPQHMDKALLFAHMEPKVRDVMRTLRAKGLAGMLNRYDATAYTDLLLPWLNRAAKQTVETPATGWAGKLTDKFFRGARRRSGMAAMFVNFTNAMQQITGLSIAAVKVKPHYLKAATWRYLRAPSEVAEQIAALSPFMATRQQNEVMQMRQAIDDLLLNPNAYEKAQAWSAKHAYFLQSAAQNVVDTITWAGAFDQATADGASEQDAIRAANAAVRETQGSLSPEDISSFESGTAFTRVFTQFTSYFNMQANILGTEFAKIAQDVGLKAGAGRLFYVLLLGFLVPSWVSEAIVLGMRGELGDEDDDGYLDDFLAFFLGAPARNAAAMVPIFGQGAVLVWNSFNRKPYDDRMSTAPAVSMIESAASAPHSVYKAIAEDGSWKRAARDTLTLVSISTGIPVSALGKPIGYGLDVAQGRVEPTSAADAMRGAMSGVASAGSK
ncbi:MAG: hypothetical protein ROZ37_04245 [Aromatoleum sp.]|jgi:hypothetical protein|uniref:hypothetical protein n=1 Tax=Aromatoleum sp. TaxID=2307007 RepID=UPI002894D126|nr:hypothetical protein [Aromatoleum sp.]MDT3669530.1 hypothetical protein [Aromatoleum sp.]